MDWIFDHPQIILLIILGVGSMLKSAVEARAEKAAERDFTEERENRVPIDQDTSYRKVMPSVPPPIQRADRPPPLPAGRTPSPKKRRKVKPASTAPPSFSAAEEAAGILKHQRDLAERLRQIRETKATTTGGAAATRARVAAKDTKQPTQSLGPISLRKRLTNPAEVRRAFVMREILDRPVGLR